MEGIGTPGSDARRKLLASLVALAVVATTVAVAGIGGVAAGSSTTSPHSNGIGANYTVVLPNEEDHYPGQQGGKASIHHLSSAKKVFEKNNAKGFKTLEYLVISSQRSTSPPARRTTPGPSASTGATTIRGRTPTRGFCDTARTPSSRRTRSW